MSNFIRYHIESGHIDTKISVNDESFLTPFEREGYAFLTSDFALGSHYIKDGVLTQREQFRGGGFKKNAAVGEVVTFVGMPDDLWVSLNTADPVKAEGHTLSFSQPEGETELRIDFAGKYGGTGWLVVWDELDNLKDRAKIAIDTAAEAARTRVVTPGSGQAMTYMRKADAARAFLSGATLSEAQMQRLQDEADRLSITVDEAAQSIVATADAWEAVDSAIDTLRLTTKAAISACTTGAAMEDIFRQLTWPV